MNSSQCDHQDVEYIMKAYDIPEHFRVILQYIDEEHDDVMKFAKEWSFANKVHPSVLKALVFIEYASRLHTY